MLVGIPYRPPDKIDLVNCMNQIFNEHNKLETQECYLRDFNLNLLFKGK